MTSYSISRRIVFTGGGSAGHVTPNIPLIRRCLQDQWQVFYIGSKTGIEKSLIAKEHIPYFSISCGKLRRYVSWKHLTDPFKLLAGIVHAFFILRRIKPVLIFSKGGFVSFPVVIAGKLLGIPSLLHESDLTPGLSNRLCFPLAEKICLTFPETLSFIPRYAPKALIMGPLIREEAQKACAKKGREISQFSTPKKILFVYAGGHGSERINQAIRSILPELLTQFNIIHSCGQGKLDVALQQPGYLQFEYLHETFYHLLACADLVISRSGSNTLSELLLFQKPHILIPLSKRASRGEQLFNAHYFEKRGTSIVLEEDQLNKKNLLSAIDSALHEAGARQTAMQQHAMGKGTDKVYQLIASFVYNNCPS